MAKRKNKLPRQETETKTGIYAHELQKSLEAEFAPRVDSALIAALIAEALPPTPLSSNTDQVSPDAIVHIRETLTTIIADADPDIIDLTTGPDNDGARTEEKTDTQTSQSMPTVTDDSDSVFSSAHDPGSSAWSSASSADTSPPRTSADSALAFLQASFAHIPLEKLRRYLPPVHADEKGEGDAEVGGPDIDMEAIVERLLTEEYVRELEERGLEEEDEEHGEGEWQVAGRKARVQRIAPTGTRKKTIRGTTVALNDVRQRHQLQLRPAPSASKGAHVDPWNEKASLAAHLADLLPSHPQSFFLSHLHSPTHRTHAEAVRAALAAARKDGEATGPPRGVDDNEGGDVDAEAETALFVFLEVLSPTLSDDPSEGLPEKVVEDARLALTAAKGDADAAMDLVRLMQELDVDDPPVPFADFATPSDAPAKSSAPSSRKTSPKPLTLPLPTASPSSTSALSFPPLATSAPSPSTSTSWSHVARRPRAPAVHTHAAFIPALDPANMSKKERAKMRRAERAVARVPALQDSASAARPVRNAGAAAGGASASASALWGTGSRAAGGKTRAPTRSISAQILECRTLRSSALRAASRHWQRGSARTRGGEVALVYAERAREWREREGALKLAEARERVWERRLAAPSQDTIDLHHTTIAEATALAREVLAEGWVSPARPLRIITGRGSHSANGVGVLGPAVKRALEEEWVVGRWEGGLVVRGRRGVL